MLSVVILTRNEQQNIGACLESVSAFADESIVFDSGSEDRTVEIARATGATVFQHAFVNYPRQRNAALEAARGEWVLFLDADERANERVGQEVCEAVARADADASAPVLFWIPRRNYIFGKWIRHSGWWPDYQPRLLRKGRAHFDPARPVHELVVADGPEAFLQQPITHFNYNSLAQFRAKQRAYTRFEAQQLFEGGVRPRWRGRVGQPLREFARRFIALEGYKDGGHGLLLSLLMAYYAYVRQEMLSELWKTAGKEWE